MPPPEGAPLPHPIVTAAAHAFVIGFLRRCLLLVLGAPATRIANRAAWMHDAGAGLAGAAGALLGVSDPATVGVVVAAAHLGLVPLAAAWSPTVPTDPGDDAGGSRPVAWVARPATLFVLLIGFALWALPVPLARAASGKALHLADPALMEALSPGPQTLLNLATLAALSAWGLLALGLLVRERWVAAMGHHALAAFYACVGVLAAGSLVGLWSVGGLTPDVGGLAFLGLGPLVVGVYRLGSTLGAYPPWSDVTPDPSRAEAESDEAAA